MLVLRLCGVTARAGRHLLAVAAFVSAGCAPSQLVRTPSADEIPRLESAARAEPDDGETLTLLGAAYREAGRLDDATETLERALGSEPANSDALFLLGLTFEDLERYAEAVEVYEEYVALHDSGPLTDVLEDRIQWVRRAEIRRGVRAALAREREIADTPPDPTTIAVFPFRYGGESEQLRPLGAALSGLVATDLAQAGRFTVLERARLEVLLDEIARGESGFVDRTTAARGGRLLGAGRIVYGEVGGTEESLDLDAALVEVGAPSMGPTMVAETDVLERVFELQTRVVLGLFDAMGVTLTTAERERVTRRRTGSLRALLAYGRGIEASYRGDAAEAGRHFSEAAGLDPDFSEAADEARESESLVDAGSVETSEIVQRAVEEAIEALDVEEEVVDEVERAADWNPQRDGPIVTEGPLGQSTGVRVISKRPSGGGR